MLTHQSFTWDEIGRKTSFHHRRKRATILESEGVREAQINKAEGTKRATVLASEGFKLEQINNATGEAEAIRARANARAEALQTVSNQLQSEQGRNAASLQIAEQYVHAFSKLAKTNNTILLPSNTGDMSSMIASALSIYSNLQPKDRQGFLSQSTTQTSSSSTPAIESSPSHFDLKSTGDKPVVQRTKKAMTDKDTQ
ncbi:unnamed protein product [Adineta steineri]|uniref:STML2-like C-terminal extension domain-containing protein n=1 Tax=Adineta steineri TaxID=433720 RepID=A0A813VFB7_9BILA|nr:unnamed protein product [Adineta steineri]